MSDREKTPDGPKGDYEVGWRRPPKQHQFKPGQSGNPSGRRAKRDAGSRAELFRKHAQTPIFVQKDGRRIKMTQFDAIHHVVFGKALKGERWAVEFVTDMAQHLGSDALTPPILIEDARDALKREMVKAMAAIEARERDEAERAARKQNGPFAKASEPDKSS